MDFTIKDNVLIKCTGEEKNITVPDGVRKISPRAFDECRFLQEVTIPEGVTEIESGTLSDNVFLLHVTLPAGVTKIGDDAFLHSNLGVVAQVLHAPYGSCAMDYAAKNGIPFKATDELIIRDGVLMCYNGKDAAFTVPDGVREIGAYAFYECDRLRDITLPDSLEKIGDNAFYFCEKLRFAGIPASVTDIGTDAFAECPRLTVVAPRNSYAVEYCLEHDIPVGRFQS